MFPTTNFHETIERFFLRHNVFTRAEDDIVMVDRTDMVRACPEADENAAYETWLSRLRQVLPKYAHVSWACRDDDFMGVAVHIEKEPESGVCDICGESVEVREDATHLSAIIWNTPGTVLCSGKRHIRCSPSRAQYIVAPEFGEPVVDDRPEFDKRLLSPAEREARETKYTEAWKKLQEEYHAADREASD